MYLYDRVDKDSKCYPAIGTIARELKLSQSIVNCTIADLEKSGRLARSRDGGRTAARTAIYII